MIIQLIKQLQTNKANEQVYYQLNQIEKILESNANLNKPEYYARWDLTVPQCSRVLKLIQQEDMSKFLSLLGFLKNKEEPLQTIKDNVCYDDFDEGFKPGG